ncbi:hypothetical protein ACLBWP_11325 [Microbacterium sp. M1A1_1b]
MPFAEDPKYVMTIILGSVTFATVLSVAMLVAGCMLAAATRGSPNEFVGALALGIASGAGGCMLGTAIRRRRRLRQR